MQISEFIRVDEVHWTDLYPKSFAEFRKKYLKLKREGKTSDLYVQFSNFKNNVMDRTAVQAADHNDPTGTFGYPLDYVLTHPADIWYGMGARYLRVLQDTSKNSINLAYINSESAAIRALQGMGFTYYQAADALEIVKKNFKYRIKGTNKFAKMFLSAVQVDVLSPPIDHRKPGFFDKGGPEFRIRSGAEQTALFRKWGVDAIEDTARSNKSAIINDREPEQIIFLTRNAFRVLEVVPLRPGIPDDQLPHMTTVSPETPRVERPLAAAIAKAMDDQISESARDKSVRQRVNFDAAYHFYWTKKGRRIGIEFDRPASYYDGRKMGEKKHRGDKLSNSYQTKISVKTELGDITVSGFSDEPFSEVIAKFVRRWHDLKENPMPMGWTPQDAASFMAAVDAQKQEYHRRHREEERRKTLKDWPEFVTGAKQVADYYGFPFEPPKDDDGRYGLLESLRWFGNHVYRQKEDRPFDETLAEFLEAYNHVARLDYTPETSTAFQQALDLIKRMVKDISPRWWIKRGVYMFSTFWRELEDKLSNQKNTA